MRTSQRTITKSISCTGVALHSGLQVRMNFIPAEPNTGIVFVRTDIESEKNVIEARYDAVVDTRLCTTISNRYGVKVATIEHLMAAVWGCGIDNLLIEIDGPEIPIMDGSAEPFVFMIECAGHVEQEAKRKIIEILKPIEVKMGDSIASITPANRFSVAIEIDFPHQVIGNQKLRFESSDLSFKMDLCRARTFGFEHEVEQLKAMGLARGGSLENAIVVGKDGVLNKDGLRFDNEFARHKMLDSIGDYCLAPGYILGHITAFKPGHGINNMLLRELFADSEAWRVDENGAY